MSGNSSQPTQASNIHSGIRTSLVKANKTVTTPTVLSDSGTVQVYNKINLTQLLQLTTQGTAPDDPPAGTAHLYLDNSFALHLVVNNGGMVTDNTVDITPVV